MRNGFLSLIFASLAASGLYLVAGSGNAQAQYSHNVTVSSGKSQYVHSYLGWNADCSHKTVDVDIIERPSHGKVSPRIVTQKIEKAEIGSVGICRGKSVRAVAIYYKSNRGYRGVDRFKVRMRLDFGFPATYVYRIQVK